MKDLDVEIRHDKKGIIEHEGKQSSSWGNQPHLVN